MAMSDDEKAYEIIKTTEELADKILANKHERVQLDKRRQETREARRAVEKLPSNEKKVWITIGSMLVKVERNKALELLQRDADVVQLEIQKLDSRQFELVNKHRDLEHFSPYTGTYLKPLSSKEFVAFKANFPGL